MRPISGASVASPYLNVVSVNLMARDGWLCAFHKLIHIGYTWSLAFSNCRVEHFFLPPSTWPVCFRISPTCGTRDASVCFSITSELELPSCDSWHRQYFLLVRTNLRHLAWWTEWTDMAKLQADDRTDVRWLPWRTADVDSFFFPFFSCSFMPVWHCWGANRNK